MDKESLKNTRENWYKAYFSGDVETLKRIESDDFVIISKTGKQSKKSQINGIEKAKAQNNWFYYGARKNDLAIEYETESEGFIVKGKGQVFIEGTAGEITSFYEHWRYLNDRWIVTKLDLQSNIYET